jgi:hypothetical protein
MLGLLFYALSCMGLFLGAAITAVALVQTASRLRWPEDFMSGFTIGHMINMAGPGLWLMLGSLLLMAVGQGLRRLDQIAANTAHLAEDP